MNLSNRKRLLSIGVISIICVVFLGFGSCKQVVIPDAVVKVINGCGVAIDIFLNGEYKLSLENDQSQSLEDLPNGDHLLEASRKGSEIFVDRQELNVIFNQLYTWTVWSSASIKIINNYGETIGIYGDDFYSGTVEDQSDVTLEHVPYGDHTLEARTTEETVVATTTISVLVDFTYEWTINK